MITKICDWCGTEFVTRYPRQRFCSKECLHEDIKSQRRVDCFCVTCGKLIDKTLYNSTRYCSQECRQKKQEETQNKKKSEKALKVDSNECTHKQKCVYGKVLHTGCWYCAYLEIEGKARGCEPNKDCEKYTPKTKRKRRKGLTL